MNEIRGGSITFLFLFFVCRKFSDEGVRLAAISNFLGVFCVASGCCPLFSVHMHLKTDQARVNVVGCYVGNRVVMTLYCVGEVKEQTEALLKFGRKSGFEGN